MCCLLTGSQLLCDLGAEVIKVEDFEGGDYARSYPPLMSDGNSALFHALNRGKKSVQIDLKTDAGRAQFMHLLERADILIETFRPGVLKKLGFEPTSLQVRFPSLIICSISGYGQTGPDSLRAGHDINYLAKSGALAVMAHPSLLPVQVADIAGGSYPAAVQILAALRRRDQTGKGALIDVSMTDNVYSLMTMNLARYAATQEPFSQGKDWLAGGVRKHSKQSADGENQQCQYSLCSPLRSCLSFLYQTPCYEVYRTSDGFISVGALEPKFWSSLCTSLNRPDLIEKQFPDGAKEIQHVKDELQTELIKRTNEEWKVFFKNKDCCVEIGKRRPSTMRATQCALLV